MFPVAAHQCILPFFNPTLDGGGGGGKGMILDFFPAVGFLLITQKW